MAITLTHEKIKEAFNPRHWESLDEFKEYYLLKLAEKGNYIYYTNENGVEEKINPVNHFPELKEYEVWMEGYAATGESGAAHLVGKAKARNFAQACHIVMCKSKLDWIEKENDPSNDKWCEPARWDYNPNRLSYWACGLYWSESLARKSFG